MPLNTAAALRAPYLPHPRGAQRQDSAVSLAQAILSAEDLVDEHRREALSLAVWKYTEADGRWALRYRSAGVLSDAPTSIHHEHVVLRKLLVDLMLDEPDRCADILGRAKACLVTVEEHRKLAAVSPLHAGWNRYAAAGLTIHDMLDGSILDFRSVK